MEKYEELKNLNVEAITMIELIEHLNLQDLPKLEENVFGYLNPRLIICTTPNSDFNVFFKDINNKKNKEFFYYPYNLYNKLVYINRFFIFYNRFKFRHPDHRYEFTRL